MVKHSLVISAASLCVVICCFYISLRDATNELERFVKSMTFSRNNVTKSTPRKRRKRRRSILIEQGALGVIINTGKCGTGGLTATFLESFNACRNKNINVKKMAYHQCGQRRGIIRTHNVKSGMEALGTVRGMHRKCLVLTAIRHPEHWLPSVFLQAKSGGLDLCDADVTREEYFQRYHDWLMVEHEMNKVRNAVREVRPLLLKEFGGVSLTNEMMKVEENGGFSLLENPSADGVFASCKLLFLRMEDSEKWPHILAHAMPGIRYTKTESRVDKCPKTAHHYNALQDYKLSDEEKASVLGHDPDMEEYFHVYGLL